MRLEKLGDCNEGRYQRCNERKAAHRPSDHRPDGLVEPIVEVLKLLVDLLEPLIHVLSKVVQVAPEMADVVFDDVEPREHLSILVSRDGTFVEGVLQSRLKVVAGRVAQGLPDTGRKRDGHGAAGGRRRGDVQFW